MSKEGCKAIVYGERGHSSKCSNSAGYGPDKAYCKIHAREKGETFGEMVNLYIVLPKDYYGPIRLGEYQVEDTGGKTYVCSGNDAALDYARRLPKDECARKGIFTTKEEAIAFFVQKAQRAVIVARENLEKRLQGEQEVISFERSQS
jgi:hypothetical protein